MSLHPVVHSVTERIRKRSAPSRQAYLEGIARSGPWSRMRAMPSRYACRDGALRLRMRSVTDWTTGCLSLIHI